MIVNLVNALHKGGDFDAYVAAGRRLLANEALYRASAIAHGFVGPPAQALLFVPLAPLDQRTGRCAWYIVNVVLLWYAITTWLRVLVAEAAADSRTRLESRSTRVPSTEPSRRVTERMRAAWHEGGVVLTSGWRILSILAVAYPLQTQFEHQNLNIVLLALVGCAVAALHRGRPVVGGIALGVAAALKVYPVLLLGWLALRRQRRASSTGVAAAFVVSVAPALFRGLDPFLIDVRDWQTLAGSGWPTRRANQSLAAMWGRYLLGEGPGGYPNLTFEQPLALWFAGLTALVVVAPLVLVWWRQKASRRGLIEELVCVNALAVLLSPIAWEHYWVAFFPVFAALGLRAWGPSAQHSRVAAACAFWIGLVCITLLSRPIVGWHGARTVRAWSLMSWGSLLMCGTLAALLATGPLRHHPSPDTKLRE